MGKEETDDIDEPVEIVVLEGLVRPRRWVDQRFCQVVDLSERQRRLAVFFLDLLDHDHSRDAGIVFDRNMEGIVAMGVRDRTNDGKSRVSIEQVIADNKCGAPSLLFVP